MEGWLHRAGGVSRRRAMLREKQSFLCLEKEDGEQHGFRGPPLPLSSC